MCGPLLTPGADSLPVPLPPQHNAPAATSRGGLARGLLCGVLDAGRPPIHALRGEPREEVCLAAQRVQPPAASPLSVGLALFGATQLRGGGRQHAVCPGRGVGEAELRNMICNILLEDSSDSSCSKKERLR